MGRYTAIRQLLIMIRRDLLSKPSERSRSSMELRFCYAAASRLLDKSRAFHFELIKPRILENEGEFRLRFEVNRTVEF